MSNADDNSPEGDSSTPPEEPRRRETILGLGFAKELQDDATQANAEVAASTGAEAGEPDEFADEQTEHAEFDTLMIEVEDDEEVREAVDRAWGEMFLAEETDVGEDEMSFPDDELPNVATLAGGAMTESTEPEDDEPAVEFPAGADTDPGDPTPAPFAASDISFEEGLDSMDLDDPLPEPIRDPTPTLDDEPDPASVSGDALRAPYPGDNAPITEFEDAATQMLDSPFETDPVVAKLVALDGPSTGQEFFATSLRNTVGRGTNNTIVVPDLAMSRQHFEIVRNPDETFSLVDLQSINGTLLNGTKVRESDLFHGDRVAAGKSRFQFVVTGSTAPPTRQRRLVPAATSTLGGEPAPPPAPTPAAPTSVNRMLVIVSVVAVIVSIVLFAVVAMLKLKQPESPPRGDADVTATYLLGVDAVKAREWDRAEAKFREAKKLDPGVDGVDEQLRRIDTERAAQALLERARTERSDGRTEAALSTLDEIARDSVYHGDAADLARQIRNDRVRDLYQRAQDSLADGNLAGAQTLASEVLELVPSHRGALAIQDQFRTAAPDAGVDAGDEEVEEVQEVADRRSRKRPRRKSSDDAWEINLDSSPRRSGSSDRVPNLTRGFMLYRTRKFKDAEAFFDKAASKPGPAADNTRRIAGAVKDFRTNYSSGVAAFKAKKWSRAQRKLIAAKRADAIVGNYFDGELRSRLATVEAQIGLRQLASDDPVDARKSLIKAAAFDASADEVKKLRSELDREARRLYVRAQARRKSDPAAAAKLCRTIKQVVGPSNESYKKATALLEELGGR